MPDKKATAHILPPRRIQEVARELHLDTERILPHGHYIAKIPVAELEAREKQPDGHLILVTAHHADAARRRQDHRQRRPG